MWLCVTCINFTFEEFSSTKNWKLLKIHISTLLFTSAFATHYFWSNFFQKMKRSKTSVAWLSRSALLYHILCVSYVNERIQSAHRTVTFIYEAILWSLQIVSSCCFVMQVNSHSLNNCSILRKKILWIEEEKT